MTASIQPFTLGQNTIRTLTIGDAVWFVATDVAEALGYRNAPDTATCSLTLGSWHAAKPVPA